MEQLAILVLCILGVSSATVVGGFLMASSFVSTSTSHSTSTSSSGLLVPLTLIHGADAKGAVCLDGTLPAYHLHRGFGSGENSWLIQLEGGGWCKSIRHCALRKATPRGSSNYMAKKLNFTGILSNRAEENPDFFNWNRVKLRYCDGASFTGDSQNEAEQLYFRGQRIWSAAMEDLMAQGMQQATQALLSGCSAGGLASIQHCDEFKELFPLSTKVKCLSDAGMFLDVIDVSGNRTLREMYEGVVSLQDVKKNLPSTCTSRMDATSCFFPQNVIADIKTPLFILNAAYDSWQVTESLIPSSADSLGNWIPCKYDQSKCNVQQTQFFEDFRNQMLEAINVFSVSDQNGLFINSCFSHCQSELQDTWFAADSPVVQSKTVAQSVGDWYFDRVAVKAIDCPFPCDNTCHNTHFRYINTDPDQPTGPSTGSSTFIPGSSTVTPISQSRRPTFNMLCLLCTMIIYALQNLYWT